MNSTGNNGNNSHNNNSHNNNNVIDPVNVKKPQEIDNMSPNVDMIALVEKKLIFFEDIMQKTLLHVQRNKLLDILAISEATTCINTLHEISKKIKEISATLHEVSSDTLINNLQIINNELSSLFKIYGTTTLEDLLWICFGNNYITTVAPSIIISDVDKSKFELLKKYFHPTSYKVINLNYKQIKEEKEKKPGKTSTAPTKEDLQLYEQSVNLDCYDISTNTDNFYLKVYGLKMIIINPAQHKALIISGIIDDINLELINNYYTRTQLAITSSTPDYDRFIASLMLKDVLICNSVSLHDKFAGMQSNVKSIQQKTVASVVKEFIANDLFIKRNTIIQLLINVDNFENQYLAYLLYDLLSNDTNGIIDTQDQTMMFDSFTWNIKSYFRDAMKNTIKYTTELSNFDTGKIPLEQQICLLKANEHVKEKAMQKLKEIKAKTEDTGSKARQYLDGLLKIPFNIYKIEPILLYIQDICSQFKTVRDTYATVHPNNALIIPHKDKYTSIELIKYTNDIKCTLHVENDKLATKLAKKTKAALIDAVHNINAFIAQHSIGITPLSLLTQDKPSILANIVACLNAFPTTHIFGLYVLLLETILEGVPLSAVTSSSSVSLKMMKDIVHIDDKFSNIRKYLGSVKYTLDEAIHGHDKAKQQIERIICQWINGEQDGHCFGFEGPPGVGKTSLAKYGLSQCLKDENGASRPFSMIQIGGDSNGSSLHGHNYTYVGSNWGSIVQILMDKKCMNPIIFIDEVDKISKTEQGREIVGILTHLLDTTQNDCFQDKYFSGIDLDLSKALFILSYNDVDAIDKVLLDRIHRIKFYNLSMEDKLVICYKHILPDIYKKMGLEDMICIDDNVMRYIIEEYTCEPGVRKLKELLFEIVGEINKTVLTTMTSNDMPSIPITLTKEMIKMNYLKDHNEIIYTMVHDEPLVGTINGMYATGGGTGGIIPIQSCFMPGTKFLDLTLTGMQGAVMKESMTVALTLAWSLTSVKQQTYIKDMYGGKNVQSIHVHCPEGAIPKDGPSAGGAITCALYSLLNNKKIRNDVAMTGEISLNGRISAIGGLDLKIYGSIHAGVKTIIYPADNQKDYLNFIEKFEGNVMLNGITFHSVSHISDVFAVALEQ